jgi:hypothetical protein
MAKTWTRSPIAPEEGVGMVYARGDYRVQRLGKSFGWTVWHGRDFLGTTRFLVDGKALTWQYEIECAWIDAHYEYKARGLTDWNLRQALMGAETRHRAREAGIYRAELERRKADLTARRTAFEAAEERARTEYTIHTFRKPFTDEPEVFNHIMGPGTGRSLCGSLYGGPGEALDLAKVDCLRCMQEYAAVTLAGVR